MQLFKFILYEGVVFFRKVIQLIFSMSTVVTFDVHVYVFSEPFSASLSHKNLKQTTESNARVGEYDVPKRKQLGHRYKNKHP